MTRKGWVDKRILDSKYYQQAPMRRKLYFGRISRIHNLSVEAFLSSPESAGRACRRHGTQQHRAGSDMERVTTTAIRSSPVKHLIRSAVVTATGVGSNPVKERIGYKAKPSIPASAFPSHNTCVDAMRPREMARRAGRACGMMRRVLLPDGRGWGS